MTNGDDTDAAWEERLQAFAWLACGLARVHAVEDGERREGSIWVVAPVADTDGLESAVSQGLDAQGLFLLDMVHVQWLLESELGAETLALAAEAAETGEPAFGVFDYYVPDPEHEAKAHEEETERLAEVQASGRLVRVRYCFESEFGFVVDFSDELVLVHKVHWPIVALNGHLAIKRAEFLGVEFDDDDFVGTALELKGERAMHPGAPLDTLGSLLQWTEDGTGPVALRQDLTDPNRSFIGAVASVAAHFVILRGIDIHGNWADYHRHALADVTAVEFGNSYLSALALVAAQEQ